MRRVGRDDGLGEEKMKITFDLDELKSLFDGMRRHYIDDVGINEYGTIHVYKKASHSAVVALESKLNGRIAEDVYYD
jgi:hypothetical protein